MEQPIMPFVGRYKKYAQSLTPIIQSKKTQNYSTVIFFFLVLSIFGWYAIRPTIQTILYLRREIKDKTALDKQMDDKVYALIEANTAYENAQPLLPVLEKAVPPNPDALSLTAEISRLAADKNVFITNIRFSNVPLSTSSGLFNKTKPEQAFTPLPMRLNIEGEYLQIVSFLKSLVDLKRILSIDTMEFSPIRNTGRMSSDSARLASIKVNLNIQTYYETK